MAFKECRSAMSKVQIALYRSAIIALMLRFITKWIISIRRMYDCSCFVWMMLSRFKFSSLFSSPSIALSLQFSLALFLSIFLLPLIVRSCEYFFPLSAIITHESYQTIRADAMAYLTRSSLYSIIIWETGNLCINWTYSLNTGCTDSNGLFNSLSPRNYRDYASSAYVLHTFHRRFYLLCVLCCCCWVFLHSEHSECFKGF